MAQRPQGCPAEQPLLSVLRALETDGQELAAITVSMALDRLHAGASGGPMRK